MGRRRRKRNKYCRGSALDQLHEATMNYYRAAHPGSVTTVYACSKCGAGVSPGATACSSCGIGLVGVRCKVCGNKIQNPGSHDTCPHCRNRREARRVRESSPPSSVSQEQPRSLWSRLKQAVSDLFT